MHAHNLIPSNPLVCDGVRVRSRHRKRCQNCRYGSRSRRRQTIISDPDSLLSSAKRSMGSWGPGKPLRTGRLLCSFCWTSSRATCSETRQKRLHRREYVFILVIQFAVHPAWISTHFSFKKKMMSFFETEGNKHVEAGSSHHIPTASVSSASCPVRHVFHHYLCPTSCRIRQQGLSHEGTVYRK